MHEDKTSGVKGTDRISSTVILSALTDIVHSRTPHSCSSSVVACCAVQAPHLNCGLHGALGETYCCLRVRKRRGTPNRSGSAAEIGSMASHVSEDMPSAGWLAPGGVDCGSSAAAATDSEAVSFLCSNRLSRYQLLRNAVPASVPSPGKGASCLQRTQQPLMKKYKGWSAGTARPDRAAK